MLILKRQRNEQIVIGDDIVLTVLWIGDKVVRLGIDAPRGIAVHRQEVADRIAIERELAE